eukprot:9059590-Karenia_brevis.AAC.1
MPNISNAVVNEEHANDLTTSKEQEKQRQHDRYTHSVDCATDTDILKMLGMLLDSESEDAQS